MKITYLLIFLICFSSVIIYPITVSKKNLACGAIVATSCAFFCDAVYTRKEFIKTEKQFSFIRNELLVFGLCQAAGVVALKTTNRLFFEHDTPYLEAIVSIHTLFIIYSLGVWFQNSLNKDLWE